MRPSTFYLFLTFFFIASSSVSAEKTGSCDGTNALCLITLITSDIENINDSRWRDYAYRDLAVSVAYNNNIDGAVALIKKINNSDTQAMTIRAIGMALAIHKKLAIEDYRIIFKKLNEATLLISNEGARDIAYTYIAMAQAFAGLDNDATITTASMTKPELKHKAFGETAEIQAERGDYKASMTSINAINSPSFKNKALALVSGIFVKRKEYENAFNAAQQITNTTKKNESLQKILDAHLGLESYRK